ncbi:MAG: nucleotidyltransferase domain-containing protein [Pseudomonadota bacterium]
MSNPVSDHMRARIVADLHKIQSEEGVQILLAVESGSRAWGFHSPDSDYDVRFIYAQPIDWHLTVDPGRDVIERPISDELDLSGWDLRKSLGLILRSNAVVLEWLQSPIVYLGDQDFRADLTEFGRQTLRRKPVMWHYLRLAQRQHDRMRDHDGSIRLKKYFYVIRPVLALRWLRLRPDLSVPPMNMSELLAGADVPVAARDLIDDLIIQKRSVSELGSVTQVPQEIDAVIAEELDAAVAFLGDQPPEPKSAQRSEADALLRKWTRRADPAEAAA